MRILIRSFFIIFLILQITGCTDTKKNTIAKKQTNQTTKIDSTQKVETTKQQKKDTTIKKIQKLNFTEGIYLTAYTVASEKFVQILDKAQSAGINTIIFDLKNMDGNIFFSVPQKDSLMREKVKPIINIPRVVKTLHERDMKAVSRIVMFHDQLKAINDSLSRPQKPDGTPWVESERRGPCWLDSSHPENQAELLEIIKLAARQGVDEIQLDYIRFPTQGKISRAIFHFQREDSLLARADSNYVFREKQDIIVDFIRRAKKICERQNVLLTADIFAIVAWQRDLDIAMTGQNITRISRHLDAIHPMIYSSHFASDFGYRQDVPNEPYHLVFKGTSLARQYAHPDCKVIPYIQANRWKVKYSYEYMISQIMAVKNCGVGGYILWNASNRYANALGWIKENRKKQVSRETND